MNLKIREFQTAIINFTNASDLPIEVKRLAFEEILHQLRETANQRLQEEIQQRNIAEKTAAESRKEDGNEQTLPED